MKKNKRRIACKNKIKHKTYKNAKIAAYILYGERKIVAFPYFCKRCKKYHIGKPSFKDNPQLFWDNIFNKNLEKWIKEAEKWNVRHVKSQM